MGKIKYDLDVIRYINIFERITNIPVKDAINNENKILFVVPTGMAGLAIGKNGVNVKKIEAMINKRVEVVEYVDNPVNFISKFLSPIRIRNIYLAEKSDGSKVMHIHASREAIPRIKARIKNIKNLLSRYFGIKEIEFH